MEAGTAIHHRLGVLGNLVIQDGGSLVIHALDGVLGADRQTPGAANALAGVDAGLVVGVEGGGAVGADLGAGVAAHAFFLLDKGLAAVVLFHFAGPGAAAHADVFQAAAEARLLVALEMGQGDEHVSVHHRPADLGLLYILAALYGDSHLVIALQTVGNNDMAAGGIGGKTVDVGRFHVIQRVFAAADIQGVAVRQEGLAALTFYQIRHGFGPVGAEIGHVARLAEIHFDGHILAVHVDVTETGSHHQPGQLLLQVFPPTGAAEICEINFRCHSVFSLSELLRTFLR